MKEIAVSFLGVLTLFIQPAFSSTEVHGVTRLSGIETSVPGSDAPVILNTETDNVSKKELAPLLDPMLQDHMLLGVGENIHVSKQIMQMENRIVKYAVQYRGVRTIFMEGPALAFQKLNLYIQTCEGQLPKLVKAASWENPEEETDLMQWLCKFNRTIADKKKTVNIYSVDVHTSGHAGQKWFLEQLDPAFRSDIKSKLVVAQKQCSADYIQSLGNAACNAIHYDLEQTICAMTFKDALTRTLAMNFVRSTFYFFQWTQAYEQETHNFYDLYKPRDASMGKNLADLYNALGKPTSLFLAHNSHVAKAPANFYKNSGNKRIIPAGAYIRAALGSNYAVIGFTGYDTVGSQGKFIKPTSPESLDLVMHNAGYKFAWIDVAHFADYDCFWWVHNENLDATKSVYDKKNKNLIDPNTVWPNGAWLKPQRTYDAMIYVDHSEEAMTWTKKPISIPSLESFRPAL